MGIIAKGYGLFLLSLIEGGAPLVRMLGLSRFLPLTELGFASALSATYSTFEQVTDFAIYRFVFSTPREDYEEALAAAHGLSLLRGLTVGLLVVAAAPLIAALLSLLSDWRDFAVLGGVFLIRGFEHLGPRVSERDYRYDIQVKSSLIANGLGLIALAIALAAAPSHRAIIAALFGQATGQVAASHLLAETPYRMKFRSPQFARAFRFGYPLMFNGLGLAVSGQGDRFVVGALLGLPALGVYAVAILATTVPLSMIGRVTATFVLAALYNASQYSDGSYRARVRLTARIIPLISASFALGILTLMNMVVPLVFGPKFTLSRTGVALLALATFVRLARGDPMTSMLLNEGRTRRLAIANLSSISALPLEIALILLLGTLEAALLGRLLGEIVALAVVIYLTRDQLGQARRDQALAMGLSLAVLGGAIILGAAAPIGVRPEPSLAVLVGGLTIFGVWAARFAPPLLRAGYPGENLFRGFT
jgi:O-antigen/teichoic acid export membrane protein